MAKKKKSWFDFVRRLFISDPRSRTEKKEKRRSWDFRVLKVKRLAPPPAPLPPVAKAWISEAEEEQRKHALKVAAAATAAADAAVAAAQVAAEVVRLTSTSTPSLQLGEGEHVSSAIGTQPNVPVSPDPQEIRKIQNISATKIQTAFRGYLARKALRALKGLVRLQAIIRGRAVRRQAITTLKCLQSVVNIQSQVCARRTEKVEGPATSEENQEPQYLRDKEIKIDLNSQRRWDDSLLSKEDANALYLSKIDAQIKRERIKGYSYNHRRSTESEQNKANGRLRYWLEQWVDTRLDKREDQLQDQETDFTSTSRIREDFKGRQIRTRNSQKQGQHDLVLDSPMHIPRRSFHYRRQRSMGEDNASFLASPAAPTYMAATESAKAKARSLSSPRLRPINLDVYSEINSPYKHKLSPLSSFNSEITCRSRTGNSNGFQQRSPGLKGLPGPIKSNRILRDLSFDSECSLPTWG